MLALTKCEKNELRYYDSPRTMSVTLADSREGRIVVLKNLSVDSTVADIEELLKSLQIVSVGIDRKVDSVGQFRGIAFVRFASPEIAKICIDKLDQSDARIGQRRVKGELLRHLSTTRSYSAREIMEAGGEADARLAKVRDMITDFLHSDIQETLLPTDFDSDQRKLAHSLGEKFGLVHVTVNPNGEALDASPRAGDYARGPLRAVLLSKTRTAGSRNSSMTFMEQGAKTHKIASFVTASVTNDLHKITPMLPEIPVYAAKPATNLDHLAMMHAAQAQVHADAAKAALEAAKRSKEQDEMPDWLEVVERPNAKVIHGKGRSRSTLNPNAPVFVPTASFAGEDDLGVPPGLTKV